MTPAYKLTRSARLDLQEISDHCISEASEEAALRVVRRVIETMVAISHHPQAGVAAGQFGTRVRKFPSGQYMIYYRPYSKGIEILHVFHGARNQVKAWRKSRT